MIGKINSSPISADQYLYLRDQLAEIRSLHDKNVKRLSRVQLLLDTHKEFVLVSTM